MRSAAAGLIVFLGCTASLGAKLALPTGWTFRARVLAADLVARAVDGRATVTTDELSNTYLRSR